jgi:hypothetical protein
MRRLVFGLILVALNWTAILAQQQDKPSSTPTNPPPAVLLVPDTLNTAAPLPRSSTLGQSQVRNPIRATDPLANPESSFVFVGGALYIRVAGGGFLAPVPGGGASGCFSVDLPRRIRILDEFVPKLPSVPRSESRRLEQPPR